VTDWSRADDGRFTMEVRVPANTAATVYLPAGDNTSVYEDGQVIESRREGATHVVEIGSGRWGFEVR
jgi:hypothetical protein